MSGNSKHVRSLVIVGGAVVLATTAGPAHAQFPAVPSCPTTSTPTVWSSSFLDSNTTKSGTVYNNSSGGQLELQRAGESFNVKQTGSPTTIVYAAVGDFDKDGWADFVGSPEATSGAQLTIMKNFTWQNENCTTAACTTYSGAAPDWGDPTLVITPKFTAVRNIRSSGKDGRFGIIAGDFNGDGWDDVFEATALTSDSYQFKTITLYLNAASNDVSGNPTFNAGYAAQSGFTVDVALGKQHWSGTSVQAVDYNKDKKLDILIASTKSNGSIRILLNNCPGSLQPSGLWLCSSAPKFTDGGYLKSGLDVGTSGFGDVSGGLPVFAYGVIDAADTLPDLLVGAPNCCSEADKRMRLYKGCSGGIGCTAGLENTNSQYVATTGGTTGVFLADFSLDGKLDMAYTTDNFNYNTAVNGGTAHYYRNTGTSTPFSAGQTTLLTNGASPTDYDVGLTMDYDHDPQHTPDILVADGNHSGGFYVIANRISPLYVECGDAASGVIDLGALIDDEMVITAARLNPSFSLNGGSITFWMSNEDPANWVLATPCADDPTEYCVAFPKPVGREVRWKAVMCSNSANTQTPVLTSIEANFDYTRANEHYRAGVVVNDGIAYVGAFHQPGDRGRFYAINAGLNTIYWDAAAKLDARSDSSRKIYTAVANLAVRLDFDTTNATDPLLQSLLQTTDDASTVELIQWVRGARFGVGDPLIPLTRLGSVETSTPAVLSKPGRPNWYSFVNALERSRIEAFIAAKANRKPLVLFGSKDGMIHALHTRPTDISNTKNGDEAWAFIPPTIAAGFLQDFTNTTAANLAAGDGTNHPTISSYPDGSPTLVDIHAGNGTYKTVAIVGEGNGGKSITALDVTETVDPVTESVTGPTPMWSATPGDGEAGQAYAKPAVARVLVNNLEKYYVIAGTGIEFNDTLDQKGRVVSAYDMATGTLAWKFEAKCPVTSDITVFETDDTTDGAGTSTLNGYADRVVFADKCGYVYKVDPNVDLAGGYYQNTGMGSIAANTAPDGKIQYALFSTASTSGALGEDRPIAGTISARTDSSTRMVLFFGTGGIESVSQTDQNAFYAVYADTGEIRSKLLGACVASKCEKFYGGTVVTPEQVIFTRTIDPAIGGGSCDPGSSKIQAVQLNDDVNNDFVADFTLAVSSAVMGALYGDAGAIYFATLTGDVARVGTPRAAEAGGDTTAGVGQGMGVGDTPSNGQVGTTSPFSLVGWRVIL